MGDPEDYNGFGAYPSMDVWWNSDIANWWNGARPHAIESMLIQFERLYEHIPVGSHVKSAILRLYVADAIASNGDVTLDLSVYALRADWNELKATWIERGAMGGWQIPGADGNMDYDSSSYASIAVNPIAVSGTMINFDITSLVQKWVSGFIPNFGLKILTSGCQNPNGTNCMGLVVVSTKEDFSRYGEFQSYDYWPTMLVDFSSSITPTATTTATSTPTAHSTSTASPTTTIVPTATWTPG